MADGAPASSDLQADRMWSRGNGINQVLVKTERSESKEGGRLKQENARKVLEMIRYQIRKRQITAHRSSYKERTKSWVRSMKSRGDRRSTLDQGRLQVRMAEETTIRKGASLAEPLSLIMCNAK